MKQLNLLILILVGLPSQSFAKPEEAKKTVKETPSLSDFEVVSGKPIVHRIRLDDYLKNLSATQVVEKMDTAGKGDSDIFIIYDKPEDGPKVLVRQLFDLDRDKHIDFVKHFEKGKQVRTEVDNDYDKKVDVVSEFDPATGKVKKKIHADGITNIWKYYKDGELRRKEVDRNSDGKPDMWVYFKNSRVTRTEVDRDFQGKIIRIDGPLDASKGKKTPASEAEGTAE